MTTRGPVYAIEDEDGSSSRWRRPGGCDWTGVVAALAERSRREAGCNTNSPFRTSVPFGTMMECPLLLILDPEQIPGALTAGLVACPHDGCVGRLRRWGHARSRPVRVTPGVSETHRPRRGRCRSCGRTQVLAWARSYPRRCDSVETVATALLAAMSGLGFRPIAEQVGVPATTVRDWIRRARRNAEIVRVDATIATHKLDPIAGPFNPTGTPIGDMIDAVGRAVRAWICRFGPGPGPWRLAAVLTDGGILACRPHARWHKI